MQFNKKTFKICLIILCLLPIQAVGLPQSGGGTFFMESKILSGFEKYEIFEDGRIWSKMKRVYLKYSVTIDGYYQFFFTHGNTKTGGIRKSIKIHRLVAMAFCPNPNEYKEVNHIDGNKLNNHYTNLEWCTRSHNIKQIYALGFRDISGKKNPNYRHGKYISENSKPR